MIALASLLLILSAPAAQAGEVAERGEIAEPEPGTKPVPLGNPGDWVMSEDYPAGPLREDIEGRTMFVVSVGLDGRVTRCKVTASSGNHELDRATCALISQRATFSPARDAQNAPVEGTWSSAVRWAIPSDSPRPEPVFFVLSYVADADGSVSKCRVERAEGLDELAVENIQRSCPGMLSEPFTDANGKPVKRRVRVTHRIEVGAI